MDKADTQKYVQLLQDENEVLNNRVRNLEGKWNYLMSRATEQAYENIKKGCIGLVQITTYEERGENKQLKSENEKLMNELSAREISESYTFEELVDLCCRQQTEISRIEELEDRHQSDCITINHLNVALDVMAEKYQRLREAYGLSLEDF